jgi:hypothetical protein
MAGKEELEERELYLEKRSGKRGSYIWKRGVLREGAIAGKEEC